MRHQTAPQLARLSSTVTPRSTEELARALESYRRHWIGVAAVRARTQLNDEGEGFPPGEGLDTCALPSLDRIVASDDSLARYSHRSIYARERPPFRVREVREHHTRLLRNADARHDDEGYVRVRGWIPGKLVESRVGIDGHKKVLRHHNAPTGGSSVANALFPRVENRSRGIALRAADLLNDFLDGRMVRTGRAKPRILTGPLYHVVILDADADRVVGTERAVVKGIDIRRSKRLNTLFIQSFMLVQAPVDKPVRLHLPIVPVHEDLCEPIKHGTAYTHEIIRLAVCDLQPFTPPPSCLMLNCQGKTLFASLHGRDLLPAPKGCRVFIRPDEKLARVLPLEDRDRYSWVRNRPAQYLIDDGDDEELALEWEPFIDGCGVKV
uniref:Uncharacterized protein n=1 Tax=Compsopogon caeruleus TaxID=31354 RepID=A0A7S1TD38_9RHOD|mmetsp:Transcript_17720/g.36779  ORF Transcript_17720/g.36779 Transcript_17720/m.36779 type:complete len:381 (+) Transcript_17720:150-1292(+)